MSGAGVPLAAMVTLTFSPTLASALAGVTVTALGASGTTGASGTSTKVIAETSVLLPFFLPLRFFDFIFNDFTEASYI